MQRTYRLAVAASYISGVGFRELLYYHVWVRKAREEGKLVPEREGPMPLWKRAGKVRAVLALFNLRAFDGKMELPAIN